MKQYCKQNIKLFRAALLLGLAATIILQTTVLAQQCYEIRDSVLRLHILANSDSSKDQLLKLKVRDRLITDGSELLTGAQNKDDAILLTSKQLEKLTALAQDELQKAGCTDSVHCSLETAYFNTRKYETVTLPAGNYTALRVIIGNGSGKNWWCVMFPPLCIPAATEVDTDREALEQVLSPGETDLVENGQQYAIKFKAVEMVQSVVNKCREWLE